MVNLINELPDLSTQENNHKFSRYITVKEEHAELVKHEIRIIWGDFIKPDHVEKFPEIHDLVWKIMSLSSKARQEVSLEVANDLLTAVLNFSDIFWKIKGREPVRVNAPYPNTGTELVLPR
jgi:nickel superoxide dismutase